MCIISCVLFQIFLIILESNEAEKSPSDEGFTELEPTEVSASITLSIVSVDQQEPAPGRTGSVDQEGGSILSHTKGRLDEEEDEGVAQNSSIEDGESLQSSTEAEKQGDQIVVSRDASDATEYGTEGRPITGGWGHRREQPADVAGLCEEEEQRKASYEANMKSWLLERMQAPIEGRSSSRHTHCVITASSLRHTFTLLTPLFPPQTCCFRLRRRANTHPCSCASRWANP